MNSSAHAIRVVVGIGCRRGCPLSEIVALLDSVLASAGVTRAQIQALATHERKSDEPALIALASALECELVLLDDVCLQAMRDRLSAVSVEAERMLGLPGVAEASALAHADTCGRGLARLLVSKHKSANATLAIARISEDA